MPRTRYRIYETEFPYFMTCSVVGWLPVFSRPACVDIVFDSLRFLQKEKEFVLLGYVIMENHLHIIARCNELSKVIQQFKSYTAKIILNRLKEIGDHHLLEQMAWEKMAHKTQSQYQFWQEGSHPQQIQSEEMMRQKLEYIHNNPVKRGYVNDPLHWRYSSARNYAGLSALIEIDKNW